MKIINPQRLKKGDVVSVISPSAGLAPFAMHRIESAILSLEKMGFKVKIEKNSLKNKGHVSGTIAERVADIHSAFKDRKVKAILCTIGGNHSNQLLKFLDFNLIKRNPKIFVGYSDITVLHHAIYKKSSLRTFYGPCVMTEFGEYPDIDPYSKKSFLGTLINGEKGKIRGSLEWTDQFLNWMDKKNWKKKRTFKPTTGYQWWRVGRAEGEIFGGAIPSINHLAGTEYWLGYKNRILFIDLPEGNRPGEGITPSDVDAFLADLYNIGIFKEIKGLIIGRAYAQNEQNMEEIKKIFLRYAKGTDYPILYNVDIGHTIPMITLPLGAKVLIDSKNGTFEIKGEFIS